MLNLVFGSIPSHPVPCRAVPPVTNLHIELRASRQLINLGVNDTLFLIQVNSRYPIFLQGRSSCQIDTWRYLIKSVCDTLPIFRGRYFYQIDTLFFLIRSHNDTHFLEVNSLIRSDKCVIFLIRSFQNI